MKTNWLKTLFARLSRNDNVERVIPRSDMTDIKYLFKYGRSEMALPHLKETFVRIARNSTMSAAALHSKMIAQLEARNDVNFQTLAERFAEIDPQSLLEPPSENETGPRMSQPGP